jgi:hypothetical protein
LSAATGVLNVVSGTSYNYVQALNMVASIVGEQPAVTSRPRTKDKVDHRFDNAALRRACPDVFFTPLDEAMRRVAASDPALAGDRHP